MRLVLLFLSACLLAGVSAEADVILAPPSTTGTPAAFVLIQGAQLNTSRYHDHVVAIQASAAKYGISLWAAVPATANDLPIFGWAVAPALSRALAALQGLGLPADAPVVLGGHSVGGIGVQDFVTANPHNVSATVFYGSTILRKYNTTYPVPFLCVNGEMDGQLRVTRAAETYYRYVVHSSDAYSAAVNSGTVLLRGVSHIQFADGQNPPLVVKLLDLKPEVSIEDARADIASHTAAFIAVQVSQDADATTFLQNAVLEEAGSFFEPLVDAMLNLEGNSHLRQPCDSDHPVPQCPFYPAYPDQGQRTPGTSSDCTCEMGWVDTAQTMMAGLPAGYGVSTVNSMHDVRDTNPFHLPHIWNNCTNGPCNLNITTVSQVVFASLDDIDVGFIPVTASELRAKLKSRQAAYQWSAVNSSATLDVDSPSICAQINQAAYQYALDNAADHARARYAQYGQPMVFADDNVVLPVGPFWINSALKLDQVQQNNQWVLRVTSVAMKTDTGNPLYKFLKVDGYHYCKLLSPARALEWIYVDGLRRQLGLNSTADIATF